MNKYITRHKTRKCRIFAIRQICPVIFALCFLFHYNFCNQHKQLSDYTETINQKIKGKLFVLTVIAIIGMIAFVIIEFTGLDTPGSVYESVAGAGLGLDCGMLIVLAMYLSGLLGKIKARREMKRKYNCK